MLRKGEKIGEYVLLDKVGSGGFGDVWKAEKRTRVDVNHFALKFFRPKDDNFDFDKISKEISVWKQLRGLPHIISVIELDQFDDYIYVVSDFADGGSLERWLNKNGKASSVDEAVKITLEILTGLQKLHEKGFVHRDIKPDNILITNGSHCLADFGISREVKSHSKATSTAGTLEYMPPEAFAKSASITKQTDIWAVGVILQKLLTGSLPYPQEDQPSLIGAILYSEAEKMPESVPRAFHAIVEKALQKKREDRFPTALAMYKALQAALIAYHDEAPGAVHATDPGSHSADTATDFNDLETIRIERSSLAENPTIQIKGETPTDSIISAENPTVQIKSETPADWIISAENPTVQIKSETHTDSIITKESAFDRTEIGPGATVAAAAPGGTKNKKPLWIAAVFILGILTIGGVAGVIWFNGSTPAANSNSGPANVAGTTSSPTPAPTPADTPVAADTPLPGVLQATPTPAPKNPVVSRERPRPENPPVRPAATPPKVKKTPGPAKNPDCIFTGKC